MTLKTSSREINPFFGMFKSTLRKNLGIIITSTPDSSHEIRVADFNPYDKSLTVNYYSVSQPKIGVDVVSYYAIYIYADKTVESFSATKNVFSVPFNLDGSLPDK